MSDEKKTENAESKYKSMKIGIIEDDGFRRYWASLSFLFKDTEYEEKYSDKKDKEK